MTHFFAFNIPCLALLLLGELLAVALQVVHLALVLTRTRGRFGVGELAFEAAIALHLTMAADFTCACAYVGSAWLAPTILGAAWGWRLWVNAGAAALAAARAVRHRSAHMIVFVVLLVLCTPPALATLGPLWNAVALLDAAFFFARGLWALVDDAEHARNEPTRLSVWDAVNSMPVGVLVVEPAGRVLLLNACMRELLLSYGLPVDLGDLHGTWDGLARHARGAQAAHGLGAGEGERLVLDVPDGRVLLAKRVEGVGALDAVGMFFLDVTALDATVRDLEGANAELALTAHRLERRLADVESIAEQAAYLRMRARVHDVVGQRLSIVQRFLEAGRIDDGSVAELSALLTSIAHDLREPAGASAASSLDAVVDAFSLVDIEVSVEGGLPTDELAADLFVRIVREASTNACRHAHAHIVRVEMGRRDGVEGPAWTISVKNDGEAPAGAIREGGGISGMRRAVEDAGGILSIDTRPAFTLAAEIPATERRCGTAVVPAAEQKESKAEEADTHV